MLITNQKILKILLLHILLSVHVLGQTLINQTVLTSFVFESTKDPVDIKLFPTGRKVLLINKDGLIRCMDLQTKIVDIWNAHHTQIIDIQWIPQNGPITLDKSGLAVRWNEVGVPQYSWKFNKTARDMTLTVDRSGTYFVAFSLANEIRQYQALKKSNATTLIIKENNLEYNLLHYDKNHNFLYSFIYRLVDPIERILRKYSCFDGEIQGEDKLRYSPFALQTYSNTQQVLITTIDVNIFNYNLEQKMIYSAANYIRKLKVCKNGLILILQQPAMITLLNGTQIQQNLYIDKFVEFTQTIDTNEEYLVVLGNNSQSKKVIMLFSYYNSTKSQDPQSDGSPLKIIVIILGSLGITIIIVLAVIAIKRQRKRNQISKSKQQNLLVINPSQLDQ